MRGGGAPLFLSFKITKIKRDPYFDMKSSHIHPMYEIYYLISGTRKIFYDGSIYVLNDGDLVFIPMNTIHKTSHMNDKTHERIVVTFGNEPLQELKHTVSDASLREIFYSKPVMHFSGTDRSYVEGLLNKMLAEYERPDNFSEVSIQDCLQELIIFLIRYKRDKRDGYIQDIDTTDRLMQEAAKYIQDNYMYELSLASVAKHVNLSPTYLSKKFKSSTGFGCWEYIVLVRVQAACVMLLETNKSITEIATACGFRNSNYFGDVFKKEKGISPLQYRKTIG